MWSQLNRFTATGLLFFGILICGSLMALSPIVSIVLLMIRLPISVILRCIGLLPTVPLVILFMTLSFVVFNAIIEKRKLIFSSSSVGVALDIPISQNLLNKLKPVIFNLAAKLVPEFEIERIPQKFILLPNVKFAFRKVRFHAPIHIDMKKSSIVLKNGYLHIDIRIHDLNGTMDLATNIPLVGKRGNLTLFAKQVHIKAKVCLVHNSTSQTITPEFKSLLIKFPHKLALHMAKSPSRFVLNTMSRFLPRALSTAISLRLQQQAKKYGPGLLEQLLKLSVNVPSFFSPKSDPSNGSGSGLDSLKLAFPNPPKITKGEMVIPIGVIGEWSSSFCQQG